MKFELTVDQNVTHQTFPDYEAAKEWVVDTAFELARNEIDEGHPVRIGKCTSSGTQAAVLLVSYKPEACSMYIKAKIVKATPKLSIKDWRAQRECHPIRHVLWIDDEQLGFGNFEVDEQTLVFTYPEHCFLIIDKDDPTYCHLCVESRNYYGIVSDMEWVLYNRYIGS